MSLTALLELHLKPDTLDQGFALLKEILVDTRNFAGCEGVEILVDTKDPAHVVVRELWESPDADAAYRRWRAGEGASELSSVLAGAPALTVLTTDPSF